MIDQDNDGWEDVTDPTEVKKLMGVRGVQQMAKGGGGNPEALETSQGRDKARAALLTIKRLQPALDRVRKLQKSTLGKQGLAALGEYNPLSSANQEYDGAVAVLTAMARPATRTPGEGAMSDFETKLAVATLPNRWKRDSYNLEAISGLQRLIDTSKEEYGRQLGLPAAPPRAQARPNGDALRRKYGLK
jgi:hypothetical protein